MTGPVVVGIDGSPAGTTAAWWAAREAASRGRPLLLHSWSTQPLDVPLAHEALGSSRTAGGSCSGPRPNCSTTTPVWS
ncbi:universal stress protein [Streptomyces sp. NPDC048324]|uniref:universal stress protein n=1 Tax=Streptomyces sp. NPDC048324 TaxID=3157205 RepID=UPI0034171B18